jgi:hypothetical protein
VPHVNRVEMSLLKGIDRVRDVLVENTERFAKGLPANNALLWGARGMGKSSLVKASHAAVNAEFARQSKSLPLKLIEIHREDIESLPDLMALTRVSSYRFIVFCDDLSFDAEDTSYKSLKALLEGGIEGRPDNVIFYATSNRRHLMSRDMMENERSTAINPGEPSKKKSRCRTGRAVARLPQPGQYLARWKAKTCPSVNAEDVRRSARMGHRAAPLGTGGLASRRRGRFRRPLEGRPPGPQRLEVAAVLIGQSSGSSISGQILRRSTRSAP